MDTIEEYEWSMGNGQCPCCNGSSPHLGWWTDTVGHRKECVLAKTMEAAGSEIIWEHENPEREIGWYCPDGTGVICGIRYNDPDKAEKLAMADKQRLTARLQAPINKAAKKLANALETAINGKYEIA